ncbi:tetratricopeptide repeat protein, partial [Acidobacteriia bacterium AH_259_A11_L15]|nr:tetratricopeptide repeat protein [Acidobacteriia bacterium AH_259_A11_L15]
MKHRKTRWLLVGMLCLALWPVPASAQETRWEALMADARKAYQRADYAEAEKLLLAARQEAEKFGKQDPRLATSLNELALLYHAQSRYAEAEPLYQRSLA